jgi:hypothetical protein
MLWWCGIKAVSFCDNTSEVLWLCSINAMRMLLQYCWIIINVRPQDVAFCGSIVSMLWLFSSRAVRVLWSEVDVWQQCCWSTVAVLCQCRCCLAQCGSVPCSTPVCGRLRKGGVINYTTVYKLQNFSSNEINAQFCFFFCLLIFIFDNLKFYRVFSCIRRARYG